MLTESFWRPPGGGGIWAGLWDKQKFTRKNHSREDHISVEEKARLRLLSQERQGEFGGCYRVWSNVAMVRWSGDGERRKVTKKTSWMEVILYLTCSKRPFTNWPQCPFPRSSPNCATATKANFLCSQYTDLAHMHTCMPGHQPLSLSKFGPPIPFFFPPPRPISQVSPLLPDYPQRCQHSVLSVLLAFCICFYYSTCPFKF